MGTSQNPNRKVVNKEEKYCPIQNSCKGSGNDDLWAWFAVAATVPETAHAQSLHFRNTSSISRAQTSHLDRAWKSYNISAIQSQKCDKFTRSAIQQANHLQQVNPSQTTVNQVKPYQVTYVFLLHPTVPGLQRSKLLEDPSPVGKPVPVVVYSGLLLCANAVHGKK